tara:strand:+ start:2112 stop:6035 length:3924 start_codon:yes stop_codon:yes gene_type:complete
MALPQWTNQSGTRLADLDERISVSLPLPLASTTGVTITKIAGQLPPGLRIENYTIIGVPFEVNRTTDFEFTLRATTDEGVLDRTFTIGVNGADAPQWLTPEGTLNIGEKLTGDFWVDTRNTSWGLFESNGISTFNPVTVTVYETKPFANVGSNGDFIFVTAEHQFYYKFNSYWRRMDSKSLQVSVGANTKISNSATVPQANATNFWFCTNKLITNGFNLRLRTFDESVNQWIPVSYFIGPTAPITPANKTVWLQTEADNLAYVPKVYNASENIWQVANFDYSNDAPSTRSRSYFVLDSELVDFQLQALDTDLATGAELRYFIADEDGELPPGLTLSTDGRITGIVEPLLALDKDLLPGYSSSPFDSSPLDFAVMDNDGYSSYYYDTTFYGYSTPTRTPKKLNRYYQFRVTVQDDVSETKRDFQIYLVGDDFLRADNTIMKAGTGIFTADNTYLRNPVFLTPGDLGVRRANNYQTLYIDVIDPNSVLGTLSYRVIPYNDDGTESELPPGMVLDGLTGELAGIIPYQPAVSKDYRFTIEAQRQEADVDITFEPIAQVYEDTLSSKTSFKIDKITNDIPGVGTVEDLEGKTVQINEFNYLVTEVDNTNTAFDIIKIDGVLNPLSSFAPLQIFENKAPGDDWVYVKDMIDRDIDFYRNRTLNFSTTERYTIQSDTVLNLWKRPTRFVRYSISCSDSVGFLQFNYDGAGFEPNPGETRFEALERHIVNLHNAKNLSFDLQYDIREISSTDQEITFDIKSNAITRNIDLFRQVFHADDSSVTPLGDDTTILATITDQFLKLYFDRNVTRSWVANTQYAFGAANNNQVYLYALDTEANVARTVKTFTVRLLGEVESTITWDTPADLGSIAANRISYLKLKANTTLEDSLLRYDLLDGRLPYGLELKRDGEIVGKANQFPSGTSLGLTTIDGRATTFDSGTTTIDRKYTFTVMARDRFGYAAVMRTFTLVVTDVDNKIYTNVYMQPFLPTTQKSTYNNFINDYEVFTPAYIYRPFDENFGVQKKLRTLAFAGIETKIINYFVAATAKNHKKKNFYFGDIKTAVAKVAGSNDVVYEVVYVEIVDDKEPTNGETQLSTTIRNRNPLTIDQIKYEVQYDVTSAESGGDTFAVTGRDDTIRLTTTSGSLIIETRSGEVLVPAAGTISIILRSGAIATVLSSAFSAESNTDALRFRPETNVISVDSDAVLSSQSTDNKKFISNITNMRKRIKEIGVNEREFLPLWMRTAQDDDINELDYVTAMPLCFCKPGTSTLIKENIVNNGFDFKKINYEIDRYIVDRTENNDNEQFILFANYQFNV